MGRWQALCDPGDAMLIPTPFYGGFETDLERRAGARCWDVPSVAARGFQIDRRDLEDALAAAHRAGPPHLTTGDGLPPLTLTRPLGVHRRACAWFDHLQPQ
jgi:hypothetical protein